MESIIKNLRYGQCNEKFRPKKSLNENDKIIYKNIMEIENTYKNLKTYDFYEQELIILKSFQKLIDNFPQYNYKPIYGIKNHKELLVIEDHNFDFITFQYYTKYINKKYTLDTNIKKILNTADHFNNIILTLKDHINMPRPYQLLPNYPHIKLKVEYSPGAISASTPSGHCFFGLFIGYLIYLSQKKFFDNNEYELNRLINISLDIGFHRNMGGIHFLYDNYISYKCFEQVISVYKYETNNKYTNMIGKILDKVFKIYKLNN